MNPLSVTPIVVLWGADQDNVPDGAKVDGIDFVAGRKLVSWLAQLDGEPVDRAAAAGIVRSLETRRASTEQARTAQDSKRTLHQSADRAR